MTNIQLTLLVELFLVQNSDTLITDMFEGLVSYLSYEHVTFGDLTIGEGDKDVLILCNDTCVLYCDDPKSLECAITYETINILDHITFEDLI